MSKINKIVTSEIESQGTTAGDIPPLGMHFDTSGTVFFSNGTQESKPVSAPGVIYGANSDSANTLHDTVKIIPDLALFDSTSDQYVVVEPNGNNDIHIRAGGEANASTANLRLGGSQNYIGVSDVDGSVSIRTQGADVGNQWTFGSDGSFTPGRAINFTSPYPFSITANLNVDSFTGNVEEFAGNSWVYTVSFAMESSGAITVSTDTPTHTSNVGFNVGDSFSFGPEITTIDGYDLELTISDITEDGAGGYTANLAVSDVPVLDPAIVATKPMIMALGTANITLGSDGTIKLDNGSEIGFGSKNGLPALQIQPSDSVVSRLNVISNNIDGNIVFVDSEDNAISSVALGTSNQYVKVGTDGNITIAAIDSARTGPSAIWKFTGDGNLSSLTDTITLKASTSADATQGLFTEPGSTLTISSGDNLVLHANGAAYSITSTGDIVFPNYSAVSGVTWANTYAGLQIVPDSNTASNVGLTVYTTGTGNRVYIAPNDDSDIDLVLGTSRQHVNLTKQGHVEIRSRAGSISDPGVANSTVGGNLILRAGDGGDNSGDAETGSQGGHVLIQSGLTTKANISGGDITIKTSGGYAGFGNINLEVDNRRWSINNHGNLNLPNNLSISSVEQVGENVGPYNTDIYSNNVGGQTDSGFSTAINLGNSVHDALFNPPVPNFSTTTGSIAANGDFTPGSSTGTFYMGTVIEVDGEVLGDLRLRDPGDPEAGYTLAVFSGSYNGPVVNSGTLIQGYSGWITRSPRTTTYIKWADGTITQVTGSQVNQYPQSLTGFLFTATNVSTKPFPITIYTANYVPAKIGAGANNKQVFFTADGDLTVPNQIFVRTGIRAEVAVSPAPYISGFSSISTAGYPGNITASGYLVASQGIVTTANLTVGNIIFADGSVQSTAANGGSAAITVDITNTNGLTTTYYPTFVEARTNGQYMRADVDLTYRTDDNLLRSGNIQVGHNIYGSYRSGLSTAIQFRPNIDIDKRFLFTVDSSGGTYVRSSMEMPSAEVDKAVTLAFPHLNSNAGYIYVQGADTAGTEFNNAFNIMMNSGNVKISALSGGGNRVWTFDTAGALTTPYGLKVTDQYIQHPGTGNFISLNNDTGVDIIGYGELRLGSNFGAVGGSKIWKFNTGGGLTFPDTTTQSTAWTGAAVGVQSTPPASPVTGQLYYDTDDGRTYIYTGSAWVDASPAGSQSTWQQIDLTAGSGVGALYLTSSSPEYTYVTTSNESRNIRLPDSTGLVLGRRFVVRNSGNAGLPIQISTGTAFNISIYQNQTVVATVANVSVNGTSSWMLDIQGSALTGSGAHVMAFSPTITSPTLSGITKIGGVQETFTNLVNATGVVNHDCSTTSVFRHTTPAANWTANFINMYLAGGSVTAVSIIIVQGATGYYPDAVQIQGAAQTINWQGNQTPTPSANRTDIVTFSILNNSGTYTVFGQLTGF